MVEMNSMGCLHNRLMQPMDVRLRSQRSVLRSDVETGRIAEMFVENEHRQKMREFFDLVCSKNRINNNETNIRMKNVGVFILVGYES